MSFSRWPILVLFLAATVWLSGTSPAMAGGKKEHGKHGKHFDECAKACTDCMRECESCALHCANQLAKGKKDHLRTLGTCMDCAEFCAAAARIVSHHGPMSSLICEACAKACDVCAKACEAHPDDQHMTDCARACRTCARACREMLEHTGTVRPAPKLDNR